MKTNRQHKNSEIMREDIKRMINHSMTLDDLHRVWSYIKSRGMQEDEVLMSWYDLKYEIIGNI